MASAGSVKVKGADEVKRSLRKLSDDIEHMQPEARRGAELVQSSAMGYARVLSGRMRGSIRIEPTSDGAQVTAGDGLGIYPAVQEYGSPRRGISPNAYMRRALEATEPRVVELMEGEVSRAADRVKGA